MATPLSCSHSNAICNHGFKKRKELRTQEQPFVAEHRGGTHYARNDPSRTRRTQEVSFVAGCTTTYLHEKIQGFVLRLPPKHKPHATFIQPLPCILQHHVANLHLSTHMATPNDNHAAIPMRSATADSRNAKNSKNYAHRNNHSLQNTEEEHGGTHYARNDPSRTRRTQEVPVIAGRSHFTRKNARFRAPASSLTQAPCNIHSAITMHFAASCSKPASLYAHGNTRWQSCSHSNAICNRRFKKCKELRTQEQPLVAEHRGGTHYARNGHSRTRRTQEVPFIAGCNHFTRKNVRFRAPASSPHHLFVTASLPHPFVTSHVIACSSFVMYYDVM